MEKPEKVSLISFILAYIFIWKRNTKQKIAQRYHKLRVKILGLWWCDRCNEWHGRRIVRYNIYGPYYRKFATIHVCSVGNKELKNEKMDAIVEALNKQLENPATTIKCDHDLFDASMIEASKLITKIRYGVDHHFMA